MSIFGLGKRNPGSMPQQSGCPNISKCAMFPRFSLETALKIWQSHYCNRHYTTCERYKKLACGQTVPANLLPDGRTMGS